VSKITYKDAGVDIEKGNQAIKQIKSRIRSTYSKNVLTELGSFGGMYQLEKGDLNNPVLVSSTDGVGTKLKIAVLLNKHDTVGEDLVNHCVNDIAVSGAKPLFFLDYFACDSLSIDVFDSVISGFVRGCRNNQCSLISGETAEMPDMYHKGEYDMSGTIVGIVDKSKIIDGSKIRQDDVLVGVNSDGLHTNGYSLARKVLLKEMNVDTYVDELGGTVGEALLKVHLSYLDIIQSAIRNFDIHGISHITGGGIEGNTKRLLKNGLELNIQWDNWAKPSLFKLIQKIGNVPNEDMKATFNMGIGLVFIVPKNQIDELINSIKKQSLSAYTIGKVTKSKA